MRELRKISGDVLIIGTEAAGCAAAITVAEKAAKLVLVNKGAFGRSGIGCQAPNRRSERAELTGKAYYSCDSLNFAVKFTLQRRAHFYEDL